MISGIEDHAPCCIKPGIKSSPCRRLKCGTKYQCRWMVPTEITKIRRRNALLIPHSFEYIAAHSVSPSVLQTIGCQLLQIQCAGMHGELSRRYGPFGNSALSMPDGATRKRNHSLITISSIFSERCELLHTSFKDISRVTRQVAWCSWVAAVWQVMFF